ncbi:MAG: hypothetical protein OXI24_07575 [Candidatus Poribacteria bacterium]|nr:hypothetical protein [Candidatus Poribacteria bacterium]
MAIRFTKLIRPDLTDINNRFTAESTVYAKAASDRMVFMSHKTGDRQAETEARYISKKHLLQVYMVEWDDSVYGDSNELPNHIMMAIRKSDGFLVNVIAEIAVSMWVGYEIGGAHAMQKARAKIMYNEVRRLPSVVGALETLHTRYELDRWIMRNIR